ncbi:uncharacterized protein EI97DRAFT_435269 [Westerdykella ornata]|uniref:Uncharacterized protein n=1 Tax=Westerdykella ornata TaxID=318751 RepID=A0A6A6JDS9_WESOR|nr:uncharacterized protein EI97DRAFT_435269 [Westerdykella ornata]KAF2274437.1 hypothetical protein EI97DRAFT_435269 [Westerdykella ornata]
MFHILLLCVLAAAQSVSPPPPPPSGPNLGYRKLWDLQNMFWTRFKYPNNVAEAMSLNSTIFSENVQGRVSDTRNFEGRELNTEYIFGLFIPSESVSVIGRPGDYEILQFAANQNIAAATTRVQFTFPSFKNLSFPVVIDTWLTWNENDEITQYDVVFRWFGYLLQTLLAAGGDGTPEENAHHAAQAIATSICKKHEKFCTGTNKQYDSFDQCFKFLTQDIRVGQSFELGMDTLLCRNVHEVMVAFRPEVHCSHIGPTGGGMCDDTISYQTKASEEYFTNSAWIPSANDL